MKLIKKIAIVVGEHSGELLAISLVNELKAKYPKLEIIGVGSSELESAGVKCFASYKDFNVMGALEVFKKIIPIVKRFFLFKKTLLEAKIDLFIGIDSPDFNLRLSRELMKQGITCIHYVSPSFWAWRPQYIHNIIKSTDMVLCLFPFEKNFYDEVSFPSYFVGHPMATRFANLAAPISKLKINFGFLPGSRNQELKYNLEELVKTAKLHRR